MVRLIGLPLRDYLDARRAAVGGGWAAGAVRRLLTDLTRGVVLAFGPPKMVLLLERGVRALPAPLNKPEIVPIFYLAARKSYMQWQHRPTCRGTISQPAGMGRCRAYIPQPWPSRRCRRPGQGRNREG